ncbi:ATP-dependent protease, La family [Hyphomonas neptunium ATCC 15444]|uniref:ATP-dependent protease, La family n=2 Tax=Hyphomonas TaxID=85 RepID=Q0BWC6_HYPNA|nr:MULTISPECIES: LON peptidase substrate-binding domain-containing protein [Hyphomonas]ABI76946.1 ATP-dependent protease, La family [Hyphomonas neptunium ATCC 15444]KCZ94792.1 ATP-dependent La family protease [Hyphomonas hirschiana VP5]
MAPYRKTADLPATLAVFPLPGALVFPRWQLPLNIFEPRYLNMIDDAMAGSRLIGMVQTAGGTRQTPGLADVGCAGRLTGFSETPDGRYLITLTGVCRFGISRELDVTTPYRQVTPDWDRFAQDLAPAPEGEGRERAALVAAFRDYAAANSLEADWSAMEEASLETLVHALASGCPFTPMEKQALLEAPDLLGRANALTALLEFGSAPGGEGPVQ